MGDERRSMNTMNKISKKLITFLLGFAVVISIFSVGSVSVWAKGQADIPKTKELVAYPERSYVFLGSSTNRPSKIRSSNESVVRIKRQKGKGYPYEGKWLLYLQARKAGTSTVTTVVDGKTYKTKVTVKKYENPIKSVRIGNTSISGSKFNRSSRISIPYSKFANKKVKTKITLKKGWKLEEINCENHRFKTEPGFSYYEPVGEDGSEGRGFGNGEKIRINQGKGSEIGILAINEKTNKQIYTWITLK